ncbi:MAG: DNA repair protein RadA [Clostridiales bacterium]|nr:DNA repair protein RadA [Clostridiales bacterium]
MKDKTLFYCTECGNESPKWMGKCQACGSWNTMVEQKIRHTQTRVSPIAQDQRQARRLSEVEDEEELRFRTGIGELDRVLGGGAVAGSLVLVGGTPGIGKSTLLLQLCGNICDTYDVLYVTGEESDRQLKLRAQRLGVRGEMFVLAQTDMDSVIRTAEAVRPGVLIIDSIQTLYDPDLTAAPGSVSQVKQCTNSLMKLAKGSGITVFIIGHVNKEGAIAGPKVLEHMVDCVLQFEGSTRSSHRVLRAVKNRFGSTNEIGVFTMENTGLQEVPNPSELLLEGRPLNTPGTCVSCVMEGTRPILAEIQALVSPSGLSVPRRMTDGFDYNRAMLLLAVLEKRAGLEISRCDAYINVVGGLNIEEPTADLAAMIALASSFRGRAVDSSTVAIGEIGLTGELRAVDNLEQRLSEVRRLGFTQAIVPFHGSARAPVQEGLHLARVRTVREAIDLAVQ